MPARAPFAALLGAVLAAFTLTACADEISRPGFTAETIAGDYDLISVDYPDAPGFFGFATGTMTLTATRYDVDVVWHDVDEPSIRDDGTYRVEGNGVGTWTQESDFTGLTSSGSYRFGNGRLEVDVTIGGVPYAFRWSKM